MPNHPSFSTDENDSSSRKEETALRRNAVSGQWTGGLCSCFRLGFCHPHLWKALLCPTILIGQILERMNLNWLAHKFTEEQRTIGASGRTNEDEGKENMSKPGIEAHRLRHPKEYPHRWTSRLILFLVVACTINDVVYDSPLFRSLGDKISHSNNKLSGTNINNVYFGRFSAALTLFISCWGLLLIVRLRRSIRERYNIPPITVSVLNPCHLGHCSSRRSMCELSLGRLEDLLCGLCCNCCILIQMARQTADYEANESASCGSYNELIEHVDGVNISSSNEYSGDSTKNVIRGKNHYSHRCPHQHTI